MFDDDAEDTRSRAEQGKKNEQFRDLYMGVKMEIADDADNGSVKSTVRIGKGDLEFIDALTERLEGEGRSVKWDEDNRRLHIDSSEASEE
ncbi:hypothetical protein CFBP6411_03337 [Pseudomonas syringae group genomosp. 3]|uniref:Uncharacterized protein n=1 Tax=Pseudomonas syringae group genomosp. 3 TaxID=251701 RepID=A0A2K4WFT3_9PSED|nr:hypothetical protein [Pseudomonas syringae group genomosp. 3]SOS34694.1 hypothetical protein CFBP6411_03337 [Pseudomonas syringae group genomosp. 3]